MLKPTLAETATTPRRIGFFLVPNFSMIAFTSAIEPFRLANYAAGRALYRWSLHSGDGAPVAGSNHARIMVDGRAAEARALDLAFVCGGNEVQTFDHRDTIAALRRLATFGTALGAVCTGAYVLARAGLLDGYRATIHWDYHDLLVSDFPMLQVSEELFEIDRSRYTCAGGLAAADLALSIVARDHGPALAARVTELLIHDRIREARERQRIDLRARTGIAHPKLLAVIEAMEANLEAPLEIAALAAGAGLSPRQMERLFKTYLGCSPSRHYAALRLERARALLRRTSLPVLEIAAACGFGSASHFSQAYRERYGIPPRLERKPHGPAA